MVLRQEFKKVFDEALKRVCIERPYDWLLFQAFEGCVSRANEHGRLVKIES